MATGVVWRPSSADFSIARVGLASTAAAACAAAAATAWLLRPPQQLPDRLAPIKEADVAIDNDTIYESFDWWNEYHPLQATNAARVPFFVETMSTVLGASTDLAGVRILDVGCGGGLVTEQVARTTRASVTGIDTSEGSIRDARAHLEVAKGSGDLNSRLKYLVGSAYELPFDDGSFDAIVSSDVFEHLLDLPTAMREMARVLRPGGVLVYDTINRSTVAWYATIVLFQRLLRFVPDHAHDWRLYITPNEMRQLTTSAGLEHGRDVCGMIPTPAMPWTIVRRWWRSRRVSLWAMMGPFILTRFTQASFLSHAVKPGKSM